MRAGTGLLAAGCAALAVVVAASAVATRRQQERELSPLPAVENGGPRGLAAARGWLEVTGRPHRVIRSGDPGPADREVVLLVAPPAPLDDASAAALLAHVERGGLLVWALGDRAQPALGRRLGVARERRSGSEAMHAAPSLAPHPLFDDVVLRTRGASLRATGAAHPAAGAREQPFAVVVPIGRGEVIVLADPGPLENLGLGGGDNLAFLARLAALGPIAFDQRHLTPTDAGPLPSRRTLAALVAQALLVAAALLLALGRRLGGIRVPVAAEGGRSARDYLASLAGLYRRAGAERELAEEAWRRLRRELEQRAGIPARIDLDEAAARLERVRPEAASALRRAATARDSGSLLETSRAAAALSSSIGGRSAHVRASHGM